MFNLLQETANQLPKSPARITCMFNSKANTEVHMVKKIIKIFRCCTYLKGTKVKVKPLKVKVGQNTHK